MKIEKQKIKDLSEGQVVDAFLFVDRKEVFTKRDGTPYLSLYLKDDTGAIEARMWEQASSFEPLFKEGDVVQVKGEVRIYNSRLQLVLSSIKAADLSPSSLRPHSSTPLGELAQGIQDLISQVQDPSLRRLSRHIFSTDPGMEKILEAPGGKRIHHVFVGGLAQHLLRVAQGSLAMLPLYPTLDKDLLITGALLHDIGKVKELEWRGLDVEYTDEGRLLGHVALGLAMVREAMVVTGISGGTSTKLLHIIASHHGEPEQGAIKRPKFIEALIVYYIDQLDSKIEGFSSFMEGDRREGEWTSYHRAFQRFIYKG